MVVVRNKVNFIIIALIFLIVIVLCNVGSVNAEETSQVNKKTFAEQSRADYALLKKTNRAVIDNAINRDQLYLELVTDGASDEEFVAHGFYKYLAREYVYAPSTKADSDGTKVTSNSPSDVSLDTPGVTYDASNNTWVIETGGRWNNHNWNTESSIGLNSNNKLGGDIKRLGGDDYYGFVFSELSKNYSNVNLQRISSNLWCNQEPYYRKLSGKNNYEEAGSRQTFTSTVHNLSTIGGVMVKVGDSIMTQHRDWLWYDYTYLAKSFNMITRFSASFAEVDGLITTYMHHNYGNAVVEEFDVKLNINLGTYVKAEVNIKVKNSSKSWEAYSGGQVRF